MAIVFAYQWMSEGKDLPNLSLPENQDALIEQVAAANPRTIVVLETGTAVTMPWIDKVSGVLEAWYAGSKGADAVANVLFGDVNPSAKLPITFPLSEADLPHPDLVKPPRPAGGDAGAVVKPEDAKPTFSVHYDEGLKVGYKWYDAENKPVLFPFGYGLSYTTYQYSDLKVEPGKEPTVRFVVKNTGSRARGRNRRGLCGVAGRCGRTSQAPGGLEQSASEPGREQGSQPADQSPRVVDLRRECRRVEAVARPLHFHGGWLVQRPPVASGHQPSLVDWRIRNAVPTVLDAARQICHPDRQRSQSSMISWCTVGPRHSKPEWAKYALRYGHPERSRADLQFHYTPRTLY